MAYEDNKELKKLVQNAEGAVMTPEEREAQRRSFVYGSGNISNPLITRELVDKVADEMAKGGTCPECGGAIHHKDSACLTCLPYEEDEC